MTSYRTFRLAALGAALLLGGGAVAAQPPAGAGQGAPPAPARRPAQGAMGTRGERQQPRGALFRDIDLTVAQRRQLRDIGLKYGDQREDLALAARKKAGVAQGQRPDSTARARLRTELQTQNRALMEKQLADQRGVLTAEQRTTFDRNVAQFRERMQTRGDRDRGDRARDGAGRGAFRERAMRDRMLRQRAFRDRALGVRGFRGGAYPGAFGERGVAPRGFRGRAYPGRAYEGRAFQRRAFPGRAFPGPGFRDRGYWRGE